jgi:hypothetical protein
MASRLMTNLNRLYFIGEAKNDVVDIFYWG